MTCVYTLSDFETIANEGNEIEIPQDVIHSLLTLTNSIVVTPDAKKTIFRERKHRDKRDYEMDRRFSPTFRTPFAESVSPNKLSGIRNALNKISQKNYDKQKDVIIESIQTILEGEERDKNITDISNLIFDIAKSNSFFSLLYATLYKEMVENVPEMNEELHKSISELKVNIENNKYVSPDNNYDEFCGYNKKNDSRKAFSTFIIHLNNLEIVSIDVVVEIITFIIDLILKWCEEESKINEIDELVENVYVFLTTEIKGLFEHDSWSTIVANVQNISNMKKSNPQSMGISSRATFRCKDILDDVRNK